MENTADYFFLANGGKSADLIRKINWESTSLGSPATWPQNLKVNLSTVLVSKLPMFLWWGTEFIQFYNDACIPLFDDDSQFNAALGQKGDSFWSSKQGFLDAVLRQIMSSKESILHQDLHIPILKNGLLIDSLWTINYTPIYDDKQRVDGVLAIYTESVLNKDIRKDLQQSRSELEFAIEAAELGTFDLDPITNRFSSNDRLKQWFGLDPDDEIPINLAIDLIAEYDRERVLGAITDAMDFDKKSSYELEYTIINPKTNEKRNVYAKGRAEFNELNQITRFSGILQDITSKKQADAEVIKSRALTDLTIKSMGIGVFTVDYNTDAVEYSPVFAKLLTGDSNAHFVRDDFRKYIHDEDLEAREIAMEKAKLTGHLYYSPRVTWKDGTVHQLVISAIRINDNVANSMLFSGTVEDITEKESNRIALEIATTVLEETKREAYAMFRNVTDSSPTGLWLSDTHGNMTYLNKTLVEWTGLPYQTLLDNGWASAVIEEDRDLAREVFSECIANKSHYDILFRINRFDGEVIWVRAAGDPFYNEDGTWAGYAGFCMDMDEIVIGRKALADSEERFSLMIEQSPLAICLFTGIDMRIEIANDAMLGYWNRNRSVMGQPLAHAMPELDGQPFLSLLQQVYTTGEVYQGNSTPAQILVNGKLENYYFDFTYKPIRDSKGKIYGVMNVANDVTQQVLATQKLIETRIALSGAIELAELSTWSFCVKTREISYSERFREWLGLPHGNAMEEEFLELISEPHRYDVRQAIQVAVETGSEGAFDIEFPLQNASSSQIRIIHAAARVFYDNDGNAEYLSGTAQDVTKERKLQEELKFKVKERTSELRKANNELEINNQELQQFAYIASHDLQEPVRKITVFMQMLESYLQSDPEKARTYITKINSSTKRMTALIKDVLGFSELAKTAMVFEPTDLNQIIRHVMNDFDLVIEQRDAQVICNRLPIIQSIPLQMSQLFGNLISNALKYSKADVPPNIEITGSELTDSEKPHFNIDQNTDYFKIDVRDNGIGFDQKYADQIFNIFQRLHGKDEFAGTGIGLAMCRKILQNHNGDIVAKSELGVGTLFTVIIPKRHEKNY